MEKLNRTTVIIASAIFAIGLWFTVNLGFDHITVKNIPLIIYNLEEETAFRTPPPETLRVRLRGEGWKLLGMQIGGEARYALDIRGERSAVVVHTLTDLSERMRLPSGMEVIEISPERFTILLEERKEKRVPVEPVTDISFRTGFNRVGPLFVMPDSVTVSGAASVINDINQWKTHPLILTDIRNPVDQPVGLSDTLSRLVSLGTEYTRVRFDVQPIAEKTISGLRIIVNGIPYNREVVIIPPRIDLVIRGGITQLAGINDDDFTARIHYRDILADTSGTISVNVSGPEEVRIVQRNPDRVEYVIRRL